MYAVSASGLIYEQNPNMGAVINALPNTKLLSVSVLNSLAANAPGTTATLRAEVTIGQAVRTSLSTFLFTLQAPFAFSSGSIPTAVESTNYATSPVALFASPAIRSYEVVSKNVFMLVFAEQFAVGRKFIVQVLLLPRRSTSSATPSRSPPPTSPSTASTTTPSLPSRPSRCSTRSRPSATRWR